MIPINLTNTAVQQIQSLELKQNSWDQDLDSYTIWGVTTQKKVLKMNPQIVQQGIPNEIESLILINMHGGTIKKSFTKYISHPMKKLKLGIIYQYEISIKSENIPSFLTFLSENGAVYEWDIETMFQKIILEQFEFYLSTKRNYGIKIFENILDIKDEALKYALEQIKLKLNQEIILSVLVEGEDQIEDLQIIKEKIPLYYKQEKTLHMATLSATLSVPPEKKSHAVALYDKSLLILDQTLAKVNDFFQDQGDLATLMEKDLSQFKTSLITKLNEFLSYLGRYCADLSISFPFDLPAKEWTEKLEIPVISFIDSSEHTVYVSFSAGLNNVQMAIQHQDKIQKHILANHIREYAASSWQDRTIQSILLNHEYQEKDLKLFISPRVEEIGYMLTDFSLQFDTYLPRKEERLLVEWTAKYSLQGGKVSLPIKVKLDGKVRDLGPWEGIITKGFNMPEWLRKSFDSDFQQHVRMEPSNFGLWGDIGIAHKALSDKLTSILKEKSQKLGIEIQHLDLEIGEPPIIALIQDLQSGLQTFSITGIVKDKEYCFLVEYQIKEVDKRYWHSFINIMGMGVDRILSKVADFIKKRMQLPFHEFLQIHAKVETIPPEEVATFGKNYIFPLIESTQIAFGLVLTQPSFVQVEADSVLLEQEEKMSILRSRSRFLSKEAKEYEEFIQKDLILLKKKLVELNHNHMQFGETAADIAHAKIRNLLKNYARLLDDPAISQEEA